MSTKKKIVKPSCPFCKSKMVVKKGYKDKYFVRCKDNNCCITKYADTEEEAIKLWQDGKYVLTTEENIRLDKKVTNKTIYDVFDTDIKSVSNAAKEIDDITEEKQPAKETKEKPKQTKKPQQKTEKQKTADTKQKQKKSPKSTQEKEKQEGKNGNQLEKGVRSTPTRTSSGTKRKFHNKTPNTDRNA